MGNRKLPFGYQMCMGEIVRRESEAKAVQEIFLQYALGASLKEIAISVYCMGVLLRKFQTSRRYHTTRCCGKQFAK